MKIKITSKFAPAAVGSYSQAIRAENLLFCSGQLAIDPRTNLLIEDDASAQAKQVMNNIGAVLKAAEMDYDNIIKTTVFLQNMEDFSKVDSVYSSFFCGDYPARSCFAVSALPKNALLEIEVIAFKA